MRTKVAAAGIGAATLGILYLIGKNDLYHYGRAKEAFAYAKANFDPVYAAQWTKKHTFEVLVHRLRRNYLKANTITHYDYPTSTSYSLHGGLKTTFHTVPRTTCIPGSRVGIESFVENLHPADYQELEQAIDHAGYSMDQTKKWIGAGGYPGAGRNPYPIDPAPGWRTFWFGCKAAPVAAAGIWVAVQAKDTDGLP